MSKHIHQAYLGLGSNMPLGGECSLEILERALMAMDRESSITIKSVSPVYLSDPVGGPSQPAYYNAVCSVATSFEPAQLLNFTQQIEQEFGRERKERNGPRTLDIDTLLFDCSVLETIDLIIPHPRLFKRKFVLCPLSNLITYFKCGNIHYSIEKLLKGCKEQKIKFHSFLSFQKSSSDSSQ